MDSSDSYMDFSRIEPFTVAEQSRSLSASALVNTDTDRVSANFGVLLMFYDSDGHIVVLYGYEKNVRQGAGFSPNLIWINVTAIVFQPYSIPTPIDGAIFSNIYQISENRSGVEMIFDQNSVPNSIVDDYQFSVNLSSPNASLGKLEHWKLQETDCLLTNDQRPRFFTWTKAQARHFSIHLSLRQIQLFLGRTHHLFRQVYSGVSLPTNP